MFLSQPPKATTPSKPWAPDHGLDRIRDHLARHQRVAHAGGAHGNPVRNGDGVESHRLRALRLDARGGQARELVDVHVAGREIAPGRGDADLRLVEIALAEPDRVQHGARRRLFDAVDHQARIRADVEGSARSRPGGAVLDFLAWSHRTVAFEQIAIHAAHRLRLGADGASGTLLGIPGV